MDQYNHNDALRWDRVGGRQKDRRHLSFSMGLKMEKENTREGNILVIMSHDGLPVWFLCTHRPTWQNGTVTAPLQEKKDIVFWYNLIIFLKMKNTGFA